MIPEIKLIVKDTETENKMEKRVTRIDNFAAPNFLSNLRNTVFPLIEIR